MNIIIAISIAIGITTIIFCIIRIILKSLLFIAKAIRNEDGKINLLPETIGVILNTAIITLYFLFK